MNRRKERREGGREGDTYRQCSLYSATRELSINSSKTLSTGASTTPTAFTHANLPLPSFPPSFPPSSFHTAEVEEGREDEDEDEDEDEEEEG